MIRDYSSLTAEPYTVRRTNVRTPFFIYMVVSVLLGIPAVIISTAGNPVAIWAFVPFILVMSIIYMRLWGLFTTVTFTPDGVTFRSPFNRYYYPWSGVKAAGMYLKYGKSFRVLRKEQFNNRYFMRVKYVWFSLEEGKQPSGFSLPSDIYCDFEFRKEAWEQFNKYLIGTEDPTKL